MFCVHCGVRLADSEKICPLCGTMVYHPEIKQKEVPPLYPKNRRPEAKPSSKVLSGAAIILFLIPLLISFLSDYQYNGKLDWFGYVAGAFLVAYTAIALPFWFARPNPVILMPCNFCVILLYLLYIDLETGGSWFLSFAFPVVGGIGLIVCTVITLLRYLKKGRLYIIGGAFAAFGVFMLLLEFLLEVTFSIAFIGWSVYPMIVLVLFGGFLIYLAIHSSAREIMERKLFF